VVVEIINESKLPAGRLAEAKAAEGLLRWDCALLRKAALLAPKDPVYWYWAAHVTYILTPDTPFVRSRPLLRRSLAADPTYLPALYAYAASEPKPQQRVSALERVARLDAHNAAPYYLMAFALADKTLQGRVIDKNHGVCVMSDAEWSAVLDLVKKGNAQPALRAALGRQPSCRDIALWVGKKRLSQGQIEDYVMSTEEGTMGALTPSDPMGWDGASQARQLCRQGSWQARKARLAGRIDAARETIRELLDFARKCTASEPLRVMPFLDGTAMRAIAAKEAEEFCRQTGDRKWLACLRHEREAWEAARKRVYALINKPENTPLFSAKKQEAEMRKILADLGLTKPPTRKSAPHVDSAPGS
jgi:hypothetical protein